jgi:hypothetical protein
MPFTFSGIKPEPTLEYDVMDAASQAPFRVTIAAGVVGLDFQHGGVRVTRAGDPRSPMGFFVPGLPPLSGPGALIVPELSLSQVGVYLTNVHDMHLHGVGDVQTQVAADPQRGGQACVYLSFSAVGEDPMGLRYRVTLYRPR